MVKAAQTMEERMKMLFGFLEDKKDFHPISDFLKSTYHTPVSNVPAQWTNISELRRLKEALSKQVLEGKIEIRANAHLLLGKRYYYGDAQVQRFNNLATIGLEAKIV